MQDKYGISNDPDCYSGTDVLKNRLNLRDAGALAEAEKALTEARAALFEPDFASFDLSTLQAIHRYLFQDIYVWAGDLRSVDISKGSTRFCSAPYIRHYL